MIFFKVIFWDFSRFFQIFFSGMGWHPVYFKKTSAAPFSNRSPKLRGACVCTWADQQNLQGGAAPPHQTEMRWTEKDKFLCLSAPLVKTPHFSRLLCWLGLARYSQNYLGCWTRELCLNRLFLILRNTEFFGGLNKNIRKKNWIKKKMIYWDF